MRTLRLLAVLLGISGLSSASQAGLLYAIRETDNTLISIDTISLAYTVIGPTGVSGNFAGLAYDVLSDTLYYVPGRGNENLYTVNRSTGAATLVGSHGIPDLFGLEFDASSGTLYGSQLAGGSGLYSLDTATGAATVINAAMANPIGALALDTSRDQLLGMRDGAGVLWQIDRASGAQTLVATPGNQNNSGLAYDHDADLLWNIDFIGFLFKIDPNAGYARTEVMLGLGSHDGLAYVSSQAQQPVPEPSTLALLGLSLAGMIAARSRRVRSD